MINTINIRNFKSLTNITLHLNRMSVIVGNNASGKSSILQAVDFLCSSVREDFKVWLDRRQLKASDIRSMLTDAEGPSFECTAELADNSGKKHQYNWKMAVSADAEISLESEVLQCDGKNLFSYSAVPGVQVKDETLIILPKGIKAGSSWMKNMNKESDHWDLIEPFLRYIQASCSFELLSPDHIKAGSKIDNNTIGLSGENLASFIAGFDKEHKQSFVAKVRQHLGNQIVDVNTEIDAGGVKRLCITEEFEKQTITIHASDISDGTLRILALIAISEMQGQSCILMLDEIENGINASDAERIIKLFQSLTNYQIIMTTHSTIFLDYVEPDDIIFIYRDASGNTIAQKMFKTKDMKELLNVLYPGEILLNLTPEELIKRLRSGN